MAKLALIATVEVARGHEEDVLSLLMAHRARCLQDEPGTLQFEVLASREDDAKVLTYEVYRDAAAFELHRSGPSIARWRKETEGIIVRLQVVQCALVEPRSK